MTDRTEPPPEPRRLSAITCNRSDGSEHAHRVALAAHVSHIVRAVVSGVPPPIAAGRRGLDWVLLMEGRTMIMIESTG
jgi:hypothetical protein